MFQNKSERFQNNLENLARTFVKCSLEQICEMFWDKMNVPEHSQYRTIY